MAKPNPLGRLPALPETLPKVSTPGSPSVFQKPTLGQAVQLGELYDARSASFLGAQLYAQDKMIDATTKTYNRFGDLSLATANTLQNKSATIDLSAELSVEVLGGLIKVSGSASYFHDSKSNTQERSWALTYKARFMEERLCFSEEALGGHVLPLIQTNFLLNNAATHFVSAIQYGGNVIVRMTAKESTLDEQDKIEGKLQASFEGLKAALNVSGSVSVKIDSTLSELNSKFDVQVYGDVALDTVPLNPEDVTVTFSEATKALVEKHDDGTEGVPISVTLQPIPESLFEAAQIIHRIDQTTLNYYMNEFALLEDIHCRFNVLDEFAKASKDVIPDFATNRVQPAFNDFRDGYRVCLEELGEHLKKILVGGEVDSLQLLQRVRKLHERHTMKSLAGDPVAGLSKPLYELEPFFFKFRDFVSGIRENGYRLSSVNEVSLAARKGSAIPLILMPPIKVDDLTSTRKLIQLSFLLRVKVPQSYKWTPNSSYLVYVEDVEDENGKIQMEDWLPNDDAVSKVPCVYSGEVSDIDGTLNWTMLWPTPQPIFDHKLNLLYSDGYLCSLTLSLVDITRYHSYTVMVRAFMWSSSRPSDTDDPLILSLDGDGGSTVVDFRVGKNLNAYVNFMDLNSPNYSMSSEANAVKVGDYFWMTFVQDAGSGKFHLYLDGEKVSSLDMPRDWAYHHRIDLLSFNNTISGSADLPRIYPEALSQHMISAILAKELAQDNAVGVAAHGDQLDKLGRARDLSGSKAPETA